MDGWMDGVDGWMDKRKRSVTVWCLIWQPEVGAISLAPEWIKRRKSSCFGRVYFVLVDRRSCNYIYIYILFFFVFVFVVVAVIPRCLGRVHGHRNLRGKVVFWLTLQSRAGFGLRSTCNLHLLLAGVGVWSPRWGVIGLRFIFIYFVAVGWGALLLTTFFLSFSFLV
jgi:hypothetical protein